MACLPELSLPRLLRPELAELSAYVPHAGEYRVRLDANEAPPLLGVEARARLGAAAARIAWERYPDATAHALRTAIAAKLGVTLPEVLTGVGSDELIALLMTAISGPRASRRATLLTTTPTFVMYRMSAKARGLGVVEVPLDASWGLSLPALQKAVELGEPSLVFIASPNNPTGTLADPDALEALVVAAKDARVGIDEAYVDYAERDHLHLYRKHPNVAILRTLSKIGFAALRVGWLVARPELVRELDKLRLPYNVGSVSQALACLALGELEADLKQLIAEVVVERERLTRAVGELSGIVVTPSQANFLWLKSERPAAEVWQGLAERGVLVRSFHARGGRLSHQLRVTVGTRAENDAFLAALGESL